MKLTDNKPPDTLGELLTLALDDLGSLDRDLYCALSSDWHNPFGLDGLCGVCLAGAVIAGTLGAEPEEHRIPSECPREWEDALCALDSIRVGMLVEAWHALTQVPDVEREPLDLIDMQITLRTTMQARGITGKVGARKEMDALVSVLRPVAEQLLEKGL